MPCSKISIVTKNITCQIGFGNVNCHTQVFCLLLDIPTIFRFSLIIKLNLHQKTAKYWMWSTWSKERSKKIRSSVFISLHNIWQASITLNLLSVSQSDGIFKVIIILNRHNFNLHVNNILPIIISNHYHKETIPSTCV